MNDPFHRRPTLFTLDPTGNWNNYTIKQSGSVILNQDRTNNEANEIETLNGSSAYIGQGANGNITKAPQGPGAYGFVYDAWNRLVQLQYSSTPISTYVYDGQNRLLSSTGINRCFYYTSAWQIAEERELSAPTVTYAQYVWGQLGRDNIVLRNRPGIPDRYYALSDYASVRAIAGTSGTLKERSGYHAYGAQYFMNPDWSHMGWSYVDWLILFDSCYISPQTWFYQMRNRVLNSTFGTWLTRDPVGYAGGLNLYAYVGNNPVSRTDPLGLMSAADCQALQQKANAAQRAKQAAQQSLTTGGCAHSAAASNLPADLTAAGAGLIGTGTLAKADAMAAQLALQKATSSGPLSYYAPPGVNESSIARTTHVGVGLVAVGTVLDTVAAVDAYQEGDYQQATVSGSSAGIGAIGIGVAVAGSVALAPVVAVAGVAAAAISGVEALALHSIDSADEANQEAYCQQVRDRLIQASAQYQNYSGQIAGGCSCTTP